MSMPQAERSDKSTDRRERILMAIHAAIVLWAAFSLTWWAAGRHVVVAGWIAIEAYIALTCMRTIRVMRRGIRDVKRLLADAREAARH